MTFRDFNLLPYDRQLVAILDHGTFPATRPDDEEGVTLYRLPGGVFAELYYDAHAKRMKVYAFTDEAKLEYYAMFVKLPDWLLEL